MNICVIGGKNKEDILDNMAVQKTVLICVLLVSIVSLSRADDTTCTLDCLENTTDGHTFCCTESLPEPKCCSEKDYYSQWPLLSDYDAEPRPVVVRGLAELIGIIIGVSVLVVVGCIVCCCCCPFCLLAKKRSRGEVVRTTEPAELRPLQQQQPQQPQYPPQQAYPPPQQGYPPPQQGYTPPQQGYTPPQQGYTPPQQEYTPEELADPPYIDNDPVARIIRSLVKYDLGINKDDLVFKREPPCHHLGAT